MMNPELLEAFKEAVEGKRRWEKLHDRPIPRACVPCRHCNSRCMYVEAIHQDWLLRGLVIRIGSGCDKATDFVKDDVRTEFAPENEAVAEWNRMNNHD